MNTETLEDTTRIFLRNWQARQHATKQTALPLPADEAAAAALVALTTGDSIDQRTAFTVLAERNEALCDPDEIRQSLSRQVVLVEAAIARWLVLAGRHSEKPNAAQRYNAAAMTATKTLALLLGCLDRMNHDERPGRYLEAGE